jgi:hypothetical protein
VLRTDSFTNGNHVSRVRADGCFDNHLAGQHVFPGSQIFLIGWAMVGEDDGYFIFFDNGSGKLFCHDPETGKQVLLSYSIAGTIDAMEARM